MKKFEINGVTYCQVAEVEPMRCLGCQIYRGSDCGFLDTAKCNDSNTILIPDTPEGRAEHVAFLARRRLGVEE
jgi:hypothetical protein